MNPVRLLFLICFLLLTGCTKEQLFNPEFEVFALLPAEGLGDRSFNDAVYEGIEQAGNEAEFRVHYIIPESLEEGVSWIHHIPGLSSGIGVPLLIIIAGNQFAGAVEDLQGRYGEGKILLVAGEATPHDGLASLNFRHYAPSWLAGNLLTKQIPENHARIIAAYDAPFLKAFSAGFEQGVTDAGGRIQDRCFIAGGLEGFSMPESAYRLTMSPLPETDLIFALGDGSNFGIINAARDFGNSRFIIGIDTDQSWMGLTVVAGSVIIRYDQEIENFIQTFSTGLFTSGNIEGSLEDGSTTFLPNPRILGDAPIADSLILIALKKESEFYRTVRMP